MFDTQNDREEIISIRNQSGKSGRRVMHTRRQSTPSATALADTQHKFTRSQHRQIESIPEVTSTGGSLLNIKIKRAGAFRKKTSGRESKNKSKDLFTQNDYAEAESLTLKSPKRFKRTKSKYLDIQGKPMDSIKIAKEVFESIDLKEQQEKSLKLYKKDPFKLNRNKSSLLPDVGSKTKRSIPASTPRDGNQTARIPVKKKAKCGIKDGVKDAK